MRDQAAALRELRSNVPFNKVQSPVMPAFTLAPKTSVSLVVASGKGGVGKTQFSVNLAIALSRLRKKVLLFDADLGLANVDIVLGMHPEWHLIHVLEGICKLRDIVMPGPEGMRVIPASSGVERLANIDASQLEFLAHELDSLEATSDFLIIDTSAGIQRSVMQFAASGDRVLVIVTPEPASFADAYATIKCIFRHNPQARIGLVVNSCRKTGEGMDIFNRMRLMVLQFLKKNIEFFGELPYEPKLLKAIRNQRPLLMEEPACPYAKGLQVTARRIAGVAECAGTKRPGTFERIFNFLTSLDDSR